MSGSFSMKGGWHPKGKDGSSKESWRGDFKGIDQVVGLLLLATSPLLHLTLCDQAGWMGKGKETPEQDRKDEKSSLKSKGMNQVVGLSLPAA